MSSPVNPIDAASVSSHRHVLVAFKYAEDAFNVREFNPRTAISGESLTNVTGDNVVILNELLDQEFSISEATWDFNFIPGIGVSTSSSVGKIVIDDRIVPYSFLDFMRTSVLDAFNEDSDNEMSLSHATFMLKTFFILGNETDIYSDIIKVNPLYFNLDSVESVTDGLGQTPSKHILYIMNSANTTGVLRSFSSIFQMDITHKDGNIHDEISRATGEGTGLRTRTAENSSNEAKRKERLDLSKPMVNLKDVFEGFEADLNQQKYTHQAQLQLWLRDIRNDSEDKIIVSPHQTKEPKPDELPIDFVVDLDPIYKEYAVDNRNMPFEQPEVKQDENGIRVFPVKTGFDIYTLIERLMMLSKQVGKDAVASNRVTFKTTITAIRKVTNRYEINIKIRQYRLPDNRLETNTGPDNNDAPLQFYINDLNERDTDVLSFKSHINYPSGDKMLEEQNEETSGAGVVYADREQGTAERLPSIPFFQSLYSGIRPMISSYTIDGLESAQRAGDIHNLMDRYTYVQRTEYEMVILGNPLLMSDLHRNPLDVINDEDGTYTYYAKPETDPMYMKLKIFERNQAIDDGDIPEIFYFDNFYHVCKVVNVFGYAGEYRSFYQYIVLRRTDDLI